MIFHYYITIDPYTCIYLISLSSSSEQVRENLALSNNVCKAFMYILVYTWQRVNNVQKNKANCKNWLELSISQLHTTQLRNSFFK